MSSTVSSRHDNAAHRHILRFAEVLRHGGCARFAELLIELLGCGGRGITGDLNQVTLNPFRAGSKRCEVGLSSVVQRGATRREIDTCLGETIL